MKTTIYTNIILTVLALLLGVIAFKPLISPQITASAQGSFGGVQLSTAWDPSSLGGGDMLYNLFDTNTGDVWVYSRNGVLVRHYQVAKLGRPWKF